VQAKEAAPSGRGCMLWWAQVMAARLLHAAVGNGGCAACRQRRLRPSRLPAVMGEGGGSRTATCCGGRRRLRCVQAKVDAPAFSRLCILGWMQAIKKGLLHAAQWAQTKEAVLQHATVGMQAKDAALLQTAVGVQAEEAALLQAAMGADEGGCATACCVVAADKGGCAAACCGGGAGEGCCAAACWGVGVQAKEAALLQAAVAGCR
jgi:hypothetical protein